MDPVYYFSDTSVSLTEDSFSDIEAPWTMYTIFAGTSVSLTGRQLLRQTGSMDHVYYCSGTSVSLTGNSFSDREAPWTTHTIFQGPLSA